MEFKSLWLASFGLFFLVVWSIDYWNLFKKPVLVIPRTSINTASFAPKFLSFIFGLVGILLITFAMTGPRKPLKFMPGNIEVNDIFLVVDVSRSMLADDLRPNRLEMAKKKLREFAALRPTDRLGVVIFSEKVYTMLPLTTDPGLIDQIISEIQIGFLGSGTNIGDALALAVGRAQNSETKNKVIVLLTDGVNNVGNLTPMQAAEMAKEFNIKVYTIGLGTHKNARLPIGKDRLGRNQYQAIPGGSIDLKTLQDISNLTGGKSYLAETEGSLNEILSEIQKLEKTEIKSQNQIIYDELFFEYLIWGIFFFGLCEVFRKFLLKEIL